MKVNKILATLIAVVMIVACMSVAAFADNGNVSTEAQLEAAVATSSNVTLTGDITLTKVLNVTGADVTIDLAGNKIIPSNTLTINGGMIVVSRGAKLTVNDSGNNGEIDATTSRKDANGKYAAIYAAIQLTKKPDTGDANAELVVNSGTIKGQYYAVVGNGSRNGTAITVNGGTLEAAEGTAIYHPQNGTLTITNGNFIGEDAAIEIRAGELNITGGTFTAKASEFSCNPNGSGTTTTGAAIAIAQHTTKKDISVSITGGTFNGVKALNESNPQENDPQPKVTLSIGEGTFNGAVDITDMPTNGFITGGTINVNSAEGLKEIANLVNNGNSLSGVNVKLTSDINLNNEEWTPIGTEDKPFKGSFDGGDFTISNLKITDVTTLPTKVRNSGDPWHVAGLFGCVNEGSVANLNINNAKISGGSHRRGNYGPAVGLLIGGSVTNVDITGNIEIDGCAHMGGVVGDARNSTVSGCTVNGLIKINEYNDLVSGGFDVGGIVGKNNAGYVKIENCTVNGTTGSNLSSLYFNGGILGYPTSDTNTYIKDCSVSGLSLSVDPTSASGGIVGCMYPGQSVTGCSVDNVTITHKGSYEENGVTNDYTTIGFISGTVLSTTDTKKATITNCTITNTTLKTQSDTELYNLYGDTFYDANDNAKHNEQYVITDNNTYPLPHNHDYSKYQVKWRVVDGKTVAIFSYQCSCNKNLVYTADPIQEGSLYTATDVHGNTATYDDGAMVAVTYNGATSNKKYGAPVTLSADGYCIWYIGEESDSNIVAYGNKYSFAATENVTVIAVPSQESANTAAVRATMTSGVNSTKFNAKWTLPETAIVQSVTIKRGYTNTDINIDKNTLINSETKFVVDLPVRNGDFTLDINNLTESTYQHALIEIKYKLSEDPENSETLISSVAKALVG